MNNQRENIAVWQEESKEVLQVHREKLLEAKTLIDTVTTHFVNSKFLC